MANIIKLVGIYGLAGLILLSGVCLTQMGEDSGSLLIAISVLLIIGIIIADYQLRWREIELEEYRIRNR